MITLLAHLPVQEALHELGVGEAVAEIGIGEDAAMQRVPKENQDSSLHTGRGNSGNLRCCNWRYSIAVCDGCPRNERALSRRNNRCK